MNPGYFGSPYEISRYYESQDIKRAGNFVGVAFLLSNIAVLGAEFILVLLGMLFRGGKTAEIISELISTDSPGMWILQIFLSALMFTLPFLIVPSGTNRRVSDVFAAKKVRPSLFILTVLMALGFCAVGDILSVAVNIVWTSLTGREMASPDFPMPADNIYGMIIFIIAVSILPPLVEEFALRGIVLGSLRRHGGLFAVMTSAMFFGLMHGNFQQGIFAFVTGVGLGLCVIVSDSVWPAVTAHFINNFLSVAMQFVQMQDFSGLSPVLGENPSETLAGILAVVYMLVFAVTGIIAFAFVLKKYGFRIRQKPQSTMSAGRRFKAFILTPGAVTAIVMFLATMVLYEFKQL